MSLIGLLEDIPDLVICLAGLSIVHFNRLYLPHSVLYLGSTAEKKLVYNSRQVWGPVDRTEWTSHCIIMDCNHN